MKAYIAIKYHEDSRNRPIIEGVSSILMKKGIQSCCITRDVESWGSTELNAKKLMQITFENIDECSFIILDLTEKGVGLGIEAGYAHAKGIPIITIARSGSDISKTLRGISSQIVFYETTNDLSKCLSKAINKNLSTFS